MNDTIRGDKRSDENKMIYAEEQAIGDTTEACERFKYTWCESIGKQNFFAEKHDTTGTKGDILTFGDVLNRMCHYSTKDFENRHIFRCVSEGENGTEIWRNPDNCIIYDIRNQIPYDFNMMEVSMGIWEEE